MTETPIEFDIWEQLPEKGTLRRTGWRPLRDIARELRKRLTDVPMLAIMPGKPAELVERYGRNTIADTLESFDLCVLVRTRPDAEKVTLADLLPDGPPRWIACYAVTGANEGHYIHVDAIANECDRAGRRLTVNLFLGKTFFGLEAAQAIAAQLGRWLGV